LPRRRFTLQMRQVATSRMAAGATNGPRAFARAAGMVSTARSSIALTGTAPLVVSSAAATVFASMGSAFAFQGLVWPRTRRARTLAATLFARQTAVPMALAQLASVSARRVGRAPPAGSHSATTIAMGTASVCSRRLACRAAACAWMVGHPLIVRSRLHLPPLLPCA